MISGNDREDDSGGTPFGLSWRAHSLFIVSTIIIGLFSETFLYGIIVPVLPFILQDHIGIPHDDLQGYSSALLAAYAGSSVICSPFAGAVADRSRSRKLSFMFGLLLSMVGTILFFTGRSIPALITARCAQGAGSSFIWTVGFALCFDTVGSENMGKTLGTVMGIVNVGALISPPLGGIAYSQAGIFGVAALGMSVLAVDLIMRVLLIEKKVAAQYVQDSPANDSEHPERSHHDTRFERREEISPAETSPLLSSQGESSEYFIAPPQSRFLRSAPILLCLRNSSLVMAIVVCGVQAALLGAFDATISLEGKDLFGFTSLQAGLFFIPLVTLRLATGPIGGWAVDRYGPKMVAVVGHAFLLPVLVLFRLIKAEPRATQIALYCVLLGLSGICMAMIGTPGFVEASSVVKRYHQRNPGLFGDNGPFASLYGMNLMAFSIGMTLGPLLAGVLRERIGYGNMNGVLGGLSGLSAIASFIWMGEKAAFFRKSSNG